MEQGFWALKPDSKDSPCETLKLEISSKGKLSIEHSGFIEINNETKQANSHIKDMTPEMAKKLRDFLNVAYPKK